MWTVCSTKRAYICFCYSVKIRISRSFATCASAILASDSALSCFSCCICTARSLFSDCVDFSFVWKPSYCSLSQLFSWAATLRSCFRRAMAVSFLRYYCWWGAVSYSICILSSSLSRKHYLSFSSSCVQFSCLRSALLIAALNLASSCLIVVSFTSDKLFAARSSFVCELNFASSKSAYSYKFTIYLYRSNMSSVVVV